jgi:hypothetical protein
LPGVDVTQFQQFVFSMRYPPNPFRKLDDTLPTSLAGGNPQSGQTLFNTANLDGGVATCVSCHAMPTGENGTIIPGQLLEEPEAKKVPQLRNLYEKTRFDDTAATTVRGFGYTHSGLIDDLFSFLQFRGFTFSNDTQRRDMTAFLLAFPTGTHPAVGAQWTMDGTNQSAGITRVNQMQTAADANLIGLVAKVRTGGMPRGWVYVGGGTYRPDKSAGPDISQATLLAIAGNGAEITFTGVIEGTEWRLGVDRDSDGFRDADELNAGSDPGDPSSTPNNAPTGIADGGRTPALLFMAGPNPTSSESRLGVHLERGGVVSLAIYDVRGALVRRLVSGTQRAAGTSVESWDLRDDAGTRVSSGVYFARLEAPGSVITRRVTVVR